ncbi:hypothetical protein ACFLZ7_02040 [Nanoarchaeota archaeon]
MNKEIHITNPAELNKKIDRFKKDGIASFHIVADFDRTLTKGLVEGQKAHTGIAQIREGGYLTPDYPKRAFALFDKYRPFEISNKIHPDIRAQKMVEWWSTHLDLLVECGMNKDVVMDIVNKNKIILREGISEFLDLLNKHKIPLLIFSAGIGDIIEEHLRAEGKLYENIHIISNTFKYNKEGKVIGYNSNIIHILNKNEGHIKNTPYYEQIADRKNVILLGDNIGDLGMIEGLEHKEVIKVGFVNEDIENNIRLYSRKFDLLVLNDGSMNPVTELIKKIF